MYVPPPATLPRATCAHASSTRRSRTGLAAATARVVILNSCAAPRQGRRDGRRELGARGGASVLNPGPEPSAHTLAKTEAARASSFGRRPRRGRRAESATGARAGAHGRRHAIFEVIAPPPGRVERGSSGNLAEKLRGGRSSSATKNFANAANATSRVDLAGLSAPRRRDLAGVSRPAHSSRIARRRHARLARAVLKRRP